MKTHLFGCSQTNKNNLNETKNIKTKQIRIRQKNHTIIAEKASRLALVLGSAMNNN